MPARGGPGGRYPTLWYGGGAGAWPPLRPATVEARDAFDVLHLALAALPEPTPCQAGPADRWHPVGSQGNGAAQAADLCAGCPVIAECLAAGVAGDERGIWGGTTAGQRDELRREARRQQARQAAAAVSAR